MQITNFQTLIFLRTVNKIQDAEKENWLINQLIRHKNTYSIMRPRNKEQPRKEARWKEENWVLTADDVLPRARVATPPPLTFLIWILNFLGTDETKSSSSPRFSPAFTGWLRRSLLNGIKTPPPSWSAAAEVGRDRENKRRVTIERANMNLMRVMPGCYAVTYREGSSIWKFWRRKDEML